MLASLLPGIRDVRVPMIVGYSWMLILWVFLGDPMSAALMDSGTLVERASAIYGLVGRVGILAAISVLAYAVGAVLTVPTESRALDVDHRLLRLNVFGRRSQREALVTLYQLRRMDTDLTTRARLAIEQVQDRVDTVASRARLQALQERLGNGEGWSVEDLRARLLVANQNLYGEYDRLAAEASFRVNVAVISPIIGLVFFVHIGLLWSLPFVALAFVMVAQGVHRMLLSGVVLARAVLAGVIELPLAEEVEEIEGLV